MIGGAEQLALDPEQEVIETVAVDVADGRRAEVGELVEVDERNCEEPQALNRVQVQEGNTAASCHLGPGQNLCDRVCAVGLDYEFGPAVAVPVEHLLLDFGETRHG